MFSLLGHRINKVRVMPEARSSRAPTSSRASGGAGRNLVLRRPLIVGAIGLAIVGLLLYSGSKIHAGEAQLNAERGSKTHDSVIGYDKLVADGFSPGVAEAVRTSSSRTTTRRRRWRKSSRRVEKTPGIAGGGRADGLAPRRHGADRGVPGGRLGERRRRQDREPSEARRPAAAAGAGRRRGEADAGRRRAGGSRLLARRLQQVPVRARCS